MIRCGLPRSASGRSSPGTVATSPQPRLSSSTGPEGARRMLLPDKQTRRVSRRGRVSPTSRTPDWTKIERALELVDRALSTPDENAAGRPDAEAEGARREPTG